MNLLPDSYTPRYLGVTLGRTLSYKAHLEKSDAKQKKKEKKKSIIQKLCGTKWGSSPYVLQSCKPLLCDWYILCSWVLNSKHTRLFVVQITPCKLSQVCSNQLSPFGYLPLAISLHPTLEERMHFKEIEINSNENLPIHHDLLDV